MDQGRKLTDQTLKEIEKKLNKEYSQAVKETQSKLDEHLRLFKVKDETKRRQLKEGIITSKEYTEWRTMQIMTGNRWTDIRHDLAEDLANKNKMAQNIINGYRPEVYATSFNYATYTVEHGLRVNTSFALYNAEAVERIIRDNPDLLPPPGKRMKYKIARGEAVRWQEGRIQSVTMQSILQGESVNNMARRIAVTLAVSDLKSAMRYARTAVNGAENAGRLDGFNRASKMGIRIKKQWAATLDNRTREAHRELDGQIVPIDEPFENSIGKIMYPGDEDADPENFWNCRCALVGALDGFTRDLSDLDIRRDDKMGSMDYDEWKEAKSKSQDILKPIEVEKTMKMRYRRDYKR